MHRNLLSVAMLGLGTLLALFSAAADPLGLGGAPGMGWKQMSGVICGVFLAIFGAYRLRSPVKS